MTGRRVTIFLLTSFIFSYGCKNVNVSASILDNSYVPVFRIESGWITKEAQRIGYLSVYECKESLDKCRTVWRISRKHPSLNPYVSTVKYGVAPPGFDVDEPAENLRLGVWYMVVISYGDYRWNYYFRLSQTEGHVEIEKLRE